MYSGVVIYPDEVKYEKKGGKLVVHSTFAKQGSLKGALHEHNALLVFEDNKKVRDVLAKKKKFLVSFGVRRARRSKNRFWGLIDKDVEEPKRKKDRVVIYIDETDGLREIIVLDNVMKDDKFLAKYLKMGKIVLLEFI